MKRIALIFTAIIFASCTVKFTSTMKRDLEESNIDFKKIQFYNSSSFALQRELSSSETGVEKGKVKIKEGKRIEIVKIPQKKPAVVDSISENTFYIIFEHGKNKEIPFRCDSYSKYYSLVTPGKGDVALDIQEYIGIPDYNLYGNIDYDGKKFYYGYSSKPILKIKRSQVNKIRKQSRTVDGIKIK